MVRETVVPGNEEWDPRNARQVMIPGYAIESLSTLDRHKIAPAKSLILEAVEFQDDELMEDVLRHIAFDAAKEGKLRNLVGKIALHDEQIKAMEAENVRARSQDRTEV